MLDSATLVTLNHLGRTLGNAPDTQAIEEAGILLSCAESRREYEQMLTEIHEGVRNVAPDQHRVDQVMNIVQNKAHSLTIEQHVS